MSAAASSEPTMVGPYIVRALLQKGPPRVVRAFDPRLKREVRLKLYRRSESDTAQIESLAASHAAVFQVHHPAIVPAYEIGEADDFVYVAGAMPAGKRLVELLADRHLPIRRAVVVARSLAEGMAVAYECGFVHGDIQPGGVVLDSEGGAAWLDFGVLSQNPPTNAAYCAPERLGDPPGPADTAGDQYGLGVLLFEMLTGQTPFTGDDAEIATEILQAERAPSARAINPKIDPKLNAICRKAMALSANERYGTCQDLADDLRRWLEGMPIAARPQGRLRRLMTNSKLLGALFAASLLGVIAMAVLLIVQHQRAQADAVAAARKLEQARDQVSGPPRLGAEPPRPKEQQEIRRLTADVQAREHELNTLRVKTANTESKLREEKTAAEESKKEEAKARSDLEADLYCEMIRRSHEFWLERDLDRANSYLRACEPLDKKRQDLRGWEWHFLRRRFQAPKTFTLKNPEGVFANSEPRAADGSDLRAASCAFSPDGLILIHCLRDDHATFWNLLVGDKAHETERQRGAVCDVVISPDGARMVTVSADKTASIWEMASGERARTLRGHDDAVTSAAFAPDSRMLATGSADHTVIVWDLGAFETKFTLKGHDSAVLGVAYQSDGKTLASCDATGVIKLWSSEDGKNKSTLTGHTGPVAAVAFSPDGQRLASAGADRTVRLWDVNSGKEIRTLAGHFRGVRTVVFRPDGKQIASAGDDRTIYLWDATGNLQSTFLTGHSEAVHRIAYRRDGRQFATASLDQSIKLWDSDRPVATEGRVLHGHTDAATALVMSPDGKTLASGGADKTVRIWDPQSGEMLRSIEGHTGAIRGLAFSADSARLASCADDGAIKIWDPATGQTIRTITNQSGAVNGIAFSPDGKRIASASADGAVRIREADSGKLHLNCGGHEGGALSVAYTKDGARLLSSGVDGSARFWDTATGEVVVGGMQRASTANLVPPPGAVWRDSAVAATGYPARIAFSPNGQRCAIVGVSGVIQVYDMSITWPIVWMEGQDQTIQSMAFSPDGRRLASGDVTGTIKVWDCRTGSEVLKLNAHNGRVAGLTFSRDGRILYSAGSDRIIRVWDGTPDEPAIKPLTGDDANNNP